MTRRFKPADFSLRHQPSLCPTRRPRWTGSRAGHGWLDGRAARSRAARSRDDAHRPDYLLNSVRLSASHSISAAGKPSNDTDTARRFDPRGHRRRPNPHPVRVRIYRGGRAIRPRRSIYCHAGGIRAGQPGHRSPAVRGTRPPRPLLGGVARLPAGARNTRIRLRSTTRVTVLSWVAANATNWASTRPRIAVAGSSAGGALAACLAQRYRGRIAAAGRIPAAAPAGARRPGHRVEGRVRRHPGVRRAGGGADVATLSGVDSAVGGCGARPAQPIERSGTGVHHLLGDRSASRRGARLCPAATAGRNRHRTTRLCRAPATASTRCCPTGEVAEQLFALQGRALRRVWDGT